MSPPGGAFRGSVGLVSVHQNAGDWPRSASNWVVVAAARVAARAPRLCPAMTVCVRWEPCWDSQVSHMVRIGPGSALVRVGLVRKSVRACGSAGEGIRTRTWGGRSPSVTAVVRALGASCRWSQWSPSRRKRTGVVLVSWPEVNMRSVQRRPSTLRSRRSRSAGWGQMCRGLRGGHRSRPAVPSRGAVGWVRSDPSSPVASWLSGSALGGPSLLLSR